jgi:hypothetical protein
MNVLKIAILGAALVVSGSAFAHGGGGGGGMHGGFGMAAKAAPAAPAMTRPAAPALRAPMLTVARPALRAPGLRAAQAGFGTGLRGGIFHPAQASFGRHRGGGFHGTPIGWRHGLGGHGFAWHGGGRRHMVRNDGRLS